MLTDLELDVERGGRFADGPVRSGCQSRGCDDSSTGAGSSADGSVLGRQEAERPEVDFHRQQMLAGLQVLLVVRAGAGEQARVNLVDVVAAAHHGAEVLAVLGEGDGAALGQFEALPHALHADADVAAVGEGREGIGRVHAGLLPAQRGRVFVAGEIGNGLVLRGGETMCYVRCHG